MALLKPDKTFDLGGVTVNEYLLTAHNPNKISMPTYPLTTVAGITVHNTDRIKDEKLAAGTTQAEQYTRATVNGNMGSVRVHFYVDENGAWQNLPFTLSGWHAADNKNGVTGPGNGTTIAIECIMSGDTSDKRNAKAEENCAKLVAALLKKYGYGTDHLFTHTYWLNKRDGRTGTLDHMNTAIHPYKWCLPVDSTEVLTPFGWVGLDEVKIGDAVAQYVPENDSIQFSNILDVVNPYESEVVRVRDIEATEDHRMYVAPTSGGPYRVESWGDSIKASHREIKTSAVIESEGINLSDDEIALIVWIQGDGHYMLDYKTRKVIGVEFHLKKDRKIRRIKEILGNLRIDYSESVCKNGTVHIRIYGSAIYAFSEMWLSDKKFRPELVNMDMHQFKVFSEELLVVDGNGSRQKMYFSSDRENLDVVQAVCATHGLRTCMTTLGTSKKWYGDNPVCVTMSDTSYNITNSSKDAPARRTTKVSCITVDSGFILIRQHAHTFIVGNCPAYILPHWADFVVKVKSYLDPAAATPATPTTSDSPKSDTNTGASKQTVRKGDKGAAVKELQTKLAAKGYLRKTEIDGDFGKITLGALLAYQFENSLEVDGVCGPKTWASLLK